MNKNIHQQRILILDFGSQYAQLIARRVREAGVYCEIVPCDISEEFIDKFSPDGVILSGGPETVTDMNTYRAPDLIFELGCPVLGICYGMQAMAAQLGGAVESSDHREFGYAKLNVHGHSALFEKIEDDVTADGIACLDVWMSHGDRVITLPEGFRVIATTSNAPIAAMADEDRKFYGLQFHPEVTHTTQGKRIMDRFIHDICGCESLWNPSNIIEDSIDTIRKKVGSDQVILGLSGGVDSSVVAALLHRAIGEQLTCVFVDTGLLRLNEAQQVMQTFAEHMGIHVIEVKAEQRFLQALEGVVDPEEKRKIIGNVFVRIFEEQAALCKDARWLAQGTIYPDVIESAGVSGKSHVIKSHHNVGGLPKDMNLKLLEPIRELFKDEVRKVGLELGLPYEMLYRHPFPGPGLGVRILGEVKKEYADLLRKADHIFIEELRKADWYHKVSQAFVVFLPVKSVGVMGDARKYDYVVSLRAVETIDFMTAHWAHLPYELLGNVSNRIINEVAGISRVTYDISGKPPATIEWE
jgi:GMP synthase (glutamine-hydrolysing)